MKPKPILRITLIVAAAVAIIFFLESTRRANKINSKPFGEVCCDGQNLRASNNDFIFFESISKYLMVSFTK